MHDEDSELAGEHVYAPTTLRSWYSMFKKCLGFSGIEPVRGLNPGTLIYSFVLVSSIDHMLKLFYHPRFTYRSRRTEGCWRSKG